MTPSLRNILVVDDDRDVADLLVAQLAQLGYAAEAAYEPRSALERFSRGAFQMVVTDMCMPAMDGIALLAAVKARAPETMVLVITGFGTIEKAVEAVRKGAFDFVSKPLEMKALSVVVDKAAGQYALDRRIAVSHRRMRLLALAVPLWIALGIGVGMVLGR